jgi:hypothetical protein
MKRAFIFGLVLSFAVMFPGVGCSYHRKDQQADAPRPAAERVQRGAWPGRHQDGRVWTAMAYPTGHAATSVVGIEKGLPAEVRVGEAFTYVIKATNLTDQTLTSVTLKDLPGDNYALASTQPEASRANDGTLTWDLGSLRPGESKTVEVTGAAESEGTISCCTSVSYMSMLCASTLVVQPALQIVKTGPGEVLRCDEIVYRYTVSNTGSGSVSGVRVTDQLASGLTTLDGQRNVAFEVDRLDAGQSRAFEVRVQAAESGTYASGATAASGRLTANTDEVRTVVREPKLTISLDGSDQLYVGTPATYDVVVTNTGDGVARDAMLEVGVDGPVRLVRATEGGTAYPGRITYNLGTLQPGDSYRGQLVYTGDTAARVHTAATARAHCAEAVSANVRTEYMGIPAVLLEVIDLMDPVAVGEPEIYVITVTNQGSAPGTNIRIVAEFEDHFEYVSTSGPTAGVVDGRKITFRPLATLNVGQTVTWEVHLRAAKPGDSRFHIEMTSDQLERPVMETEATYVY